MKVNGNGQVMLAGILWGTIGIFIWDMEKGRGIRRMDQLLTGVFFMAHLSGLRRLAKRPVFMKVTPIWSTAPC